METSEQLSKKSGKKIGLLSCLSIAIGLIIGAGIFGALPIAIQLTGKGVGLAFILATITIILRYYPTIITGATIPASFGYYMHATRLAGANLGFTQVIAAFSNIFVQAILASVFATYFCELVPADTRIVGVAILLIFGAITCLGIQTSGMVQNIMVALLLFALFTFIIGGWSHIKPENLIWKELLFPSQQSWLSLGAAIGLLSSCLMGGYIVLNFADEVRNPGRAIPISFIASTLITALIYILLSVVTIGVGSEKEISNLAVVADEFLSPGLKLFFITGGALFASLTTLNAVFISGSRCLAVVARDKVIPEWLTKTNKFGVPHNSVILLTIVPAIIVAFGVPIGTLLSAFSVLTLLFGIILFIPIIRLPQYYPLSYQISFMKLPRGVIWVFVILGTIVSVYQIGSLLAALNKPTWLALLLWLIFWYAYFYFRKAYLKRRGVDLFALMSAPYQPWEERESQLKKRKGIVYSGQNELKRDRITKFQREREHFPVLKKAAYFNTPIFGLIPDYVHEATKKVQDYRYETGDHTFLGMPQYEMIEQSREIYARFLNCQASDIAFGLSASQMFSILAAGLPVKPGDNVVVTDNSFPTIPYAFQCREQDGLEIKYAKTYAGGISAENLCTYADSKTRVIAVNHVESNTGFRMEIEKIGAFCKKKGIFLAVDAAQSAGAMVLDVEQMNISFLVCTDYKWLCHYRGFGFAYVSPQLRDYLVQRSAGWASELDRFNPFKMKLDLHPSARRYEMGGLHNSGVYCVRLVIEHYLDLGKEDVQNYILGLTEYCYQKADNCPYTSLAYRFAPENRSGIVVLHIPKEYGLSSQKLFERGVIAMVNEGENSISKTASAYHSIRLGLHYYNNKDDIDKLFSAIEDICRESFRTVYNRIALPKKQKREEKK